MGYVTDIQTDKRKKLGPLPDRYEQNVCNLNQNSQFVKMHLEQEIDKRANKFLFVCFFLS